MPKTLCPGQRQERFNFADFFEWLKLKIRHLSFPENPLNLDLALGVKIDDEKGRVEFLVGTTPPGAGNGSTRQISHVVKLTSVNPVLVAAQAELDLRVFEQQLPQLHLAAQGGRHPAEGWVRRKENG